MFHLLGPCPLAYIRLFCRRKTRFVAGKHVLSAPKRVCRRQNIALDDKTGLYMLVDTGLILCPLGMINYCPDCPGQTWTWYYNRIKSTLPTFHTRNQTYKYAQRYLNADFWRRLLTPIDRYPTFVFENLVSTCVHRETKHIFELSIEIHVFVGRQMA